MSTMIPSTFLTHFRQTKWLPFHIFKCIFMDNKQLCILKQISMKFILKGPTDNKSALVQTMAWHQIGKTPLLKPMLTQFTNAYIGHCGKCRYCKWNHLHFYWNPLHMAQLGLHFWQVNIGSGNGLMSLPGSMMTKVYDTIWCYSSTTNNKQA